MYDCYLIKTKEQIQFIESFVDYKLNTDQYEYFIESIEKIFYINYNFFATLFCYINILLFAPLIILLMAEQFSNSIYQPINKPPFSIIQLITTK